MLDVCSLKPGDVVQIVEAWPGDVGQSAIGSMDRWLGRRMTVRALHFDGCFQRSLGRSNVPHVHMEEDHDVCGGSGWSWNDYMIEYVVSYADGRSAIPEENPQDINDMITDLLFA